MRLSSEKHDPGYVDYCKKRGDGLKPVIFLNGIEQNNVITADTVEGIVKRVVMTDAGNIAHDGTDILHEIVQGKVSIDFTK